MYEHFFRRRTRKLGRERKNRRSYLRLFHFLLSPQFSRDQIAYYRYERANNDADASHVDSQSGFPRIFILHENIHVTRVVTSSAEELGTMSRYNLRGIDQFRYIKIQPKTIDPSTTLVLRSIVLG